MKALLVLSLAQFAAILGTRLTMVAIPWLVLTDLGDPGLAGIVAFAELAPYVAAKALGGPWIDRFGARRISVVADVISFCLLLMLPVLHGTGSLPPAVLIVSVAILGLARGPGDAAKFALVPGIATTSGYALTRVASVQATMDRLGGLLGAGAAALLIASIGTIETLWASAVMVGVSAVLIGFGLQSHKRASVEEEGYLFQLRSGWRFLRQEPVLLAVTLMVAVTNMLDQGMAVVLGPVWAEQSGGIAWLGTVQVAFGIGAVLGSIVASAIAERLPRLATYAICYALVGLPRFALFIVELPIWGMAIGLAAAGFFAGFINPIIGALVFERIPKALTGRVSSLFSAITWSLMPLGGVLAGALIGFVGLNWAFVIFGSAYAIATLGPVLAPAFRNIADTTKHVES